VNLVVAGAAVQKPVLLPGSSGDPSDLLKLNFRNKASLELLRRAYTALHCDDRIS
jgi:hypothetical protein